MWLLAFTGFHVRDEILMFWRKQFVMLRQEKYGLFAQMWSVAAKVIG
jgi:hypothetical protein